VALELSAAASRPAAGAVALIMCMIDEAGAIGVPVSEMKAECVTAPFASRVAVNMTPFGSMPNSRRLPAVWPPPPPPPVPQFGFTAGSVPVMPAGSVFLETALK
jgi:hypothetical protein